MKALRWIAAVAVLAVGSVAGVATSCAIDDEVVWINGAECTGACQRTAQDSYSCDVDLECTDGCATDWDCTEGDAPAPCGDAGPCDDAGLGDGSDDRDTSGDGANPGGDADGSSLEDADGGDDADVPSTCAREGGGETAESAQPITIGTSLTDLVACSTDSSWFRFEASSGAAFRVDITPYDGEVTFRIYAGAELGVMDEAEMDGAGAFAATAGATGSYFIRVRASGDTTVGYDLALSPTGGR